ncbi:O-antigen ligase family protein [Ramlibacter sp. PS4R-6]|uniref:O-antigen ligase family protein n=1 Tax=Ramlibacter sp. PS4R-6 TaxID=3133438 RepID=UPI0030A4849F
MTAIAHHANVAGRPARAAPVPAGRTAESVLCVLLAAYLLSLAVEGPLRYVLATAGLPDALYLRDAIPVGSLAFLFIRSLLHGKLELAIAIPAAVLALHAAYAAVVGVGLFPIAFGLKIFMFIPYGIAMWPLVRRRWRAALGFMCVVFAVTLAGVCLNFAVGTLPWEGLEYRTSFGPVSTTRTWWIPGGISRLPGFTRTSFNAAMILGISGLLAMLCFRRMWAQSAIAVAAFAGIVLTTSKGMVLAFPVAAAWVVLQSFRPGSGVLLVRTLCVVTLVLPLVIVFGDASAAIAADSFPPLLMSVWERFTMMWPEAFALLPQGPAAVLGAGPGSIGTPQVYGDAPHLFNAADNIAVFMLVSLGVPGVAYYALPAVGMRRLALAERPEIARAAAAMLVIAYGYGMSISMVEESFFCVVFGMCFGAVLCAFAARPRAGGGQA